MASESRMLRRIEVQRAAAVQKLRGIEANARHAQELLEKGGEGGKIVLVAGTNGAAVVDGRQCSHENDASGDA